MKLVWKENSKWAFFLFIFNKLLSRGRETSNQAKMKSTFSVSLVNMALLSLLQIMGVGSICPSLPVGAHMVFRLILPQWILHCDGLPLHHLQHSARDVYLHLSLPPPEKGKIVIVCCSIREINQGVCEAEMPTIFFFQLDKSEDLLFLSVLHIWK